MDEELLKKLAAAGDDLADSVMSAHIDGATKGAEIIKNYSTNTARAVEETAKAGTEVINKATQETSKAVKEAAESASNVMQNAFSYVSDNFSATMENIGKAFAEKISGSEFSSKMKMVFSEVTAGATEQIRNLAVNAGIDVEEVTAETFAKIGRDTAFILFNLKNIEASKPFDSLSRDGEEFANKVSANIKNLSENVLPSVGIAGPAKQFLNMAASFEAAADGARTFESSLLSAAGAAGRYNDMLERINNFKDDGFERFASNFVNRAADIGNATNQNAKDVMAWQQSLMQIRGALDATYASLGDAAEETDILTTAITVSAGAGLKVKDTLDMMTAQYMNFGTAAEDSIEDVAKLAMVAQNLEVPLEKIKGGVNSVVSSLIFYRDNTEAAVNITARLGSSLKEAGMSPEAISKLTSTVAQNVAGMQLAQRAFLSQQTGGPGGLAGGYQIELLKQQGRLDEVQRLTEEALKKQFGGRIVTLEEAAQDEGAARQLTKQVQLATSGPTKVVDTEAQAFALFEAMKRGTQADVLSGMDAVNEAAERGQQRIARQESEINKLNNAAIIAASNASLIATENSRIVSEMFRETLKNAQDVIKAGPITSGILPSLLPSREKSVTQAAQTELVGYATATSARPGTSSENLRDSLTKIISTFQGEEAALDMGGMFSNPMLRSGVVNARGEAMRRPDSNINFGTIIVETVCTECNTKHAKEVATKVMSEGVANAGMASRAQAIVGQHSH